MLLAPLAPFLLKTPDNPEGVDKSLFDGFQQAIMKDRFAYLTQFCQTLLQLRREQGQAGQRGGVPGALADRREASAKGTHDCVDAWQTDFRNDLPQIDVPVLIIQGDKDGVLPYPATGQRLAPMLPNAKLITLKGAPHGTPWTHADEVNKAIMEFIGTSRMAHA